MGNRPRESQEVQQGMKAHQGHRDGFADVTESTSHCMCTAFVCTTATLPEK